VSSESPITARTSSLLLRASVNRLATFPTRQLSERSDRLKSGHCHVCYSPIDGASYSPDGKKILFSGEESKVLRNDAVEIYTIGIHGKNRVQLTENATNDYFPDYSPDGRRIAYSGSGEKGTNIYTISARGGDKTKVTEGNDPDYSPDGKKIVYYTGNGPDGRIYTINVGGGGKSRVTEGSDPSWGIRP
jgi:TolB protein